MAVEREPSPWTNADGRTPDLKIAYFSPLPPQRSGIADYSVELLPELARLADITIFGKKQTTDGWAAGIDWQDLDAYESMFDEFDVALYHMGNSEFHDPIARLALRHPGVVVLHDVFLHHSQARRTIGSGEKYAYWREMGYERGAAGVRRAMAQEHGAVPPLFSMPLNRRLLDGSLGALVHSQFAQQQVRRQGFEGPLAIVPALVTELAGSSRRPELPVNDEAVIFAGLGLMTGEKGFVETAVSIRRLRDAGIDAHYLLVGDALPDVPIEETVHRLQLGNSVHRVGFVPELADFVNWVHTADVVVNLRNPTVGETSATALRAMAAGRPVIVSDQGWYREIPDEAVFKVPPGNEQALADRMRQLGESATLRQQMGEAGRAYVRRACLPRAVAATYVRQLEAILGAMRIYG